MSFCNGFNFTAAMRRLCADMVARLPELGHIDLDRVALSFCQARKRVPFGVQASLTPLRFEGGAKSVTRRGVRFTCQAVVDADGREFLYILNFYLPRFLDQAFEEKLSTVFHELWHISPHFDGDLRRHPGRCYAHGASQRRYDAEMDALARKWLALDPPQHLYAFLEKSFRKLKDEHGGIHGLHVPIPKLLPTNAA